jgi:CheY-like chemotaxis protein
MKRLLVVDDEPLVREALRRVLEDDAVHVDVATDARSALVQYQPGGADLVIVDVIMPGMDGVEFIRALRARDPAVRVVAISGGGNFDVGGYRPDAVSTRAYLAAASKAGADAVLAKPFDIDELEAVVRPLLAGRGPH